MNHNRTNVVEGFTRNNRQSALLTLLIHPQINNPKPFANNVSFWWGQEQEQAQAMMARLQVPYYIDMVGEDRGKFLNFTFPTTKYWYL